MRAFTKTLVIGFTFFFILLHYARASDVLILWDDAALKGIRDLKLGAPIAARNLAVLHTCAYDAWAAYDERAAGTELHDALRRPPSERTPANKEEAVSYAAYRALTDLMPADSATVFAPLMKQLGYDSDNPSTDIETAAGIGNVTCAAVLEFRHHDGSNQLGDLAQGPYTDWTGYTPVNPPNSLTKKVSIVNPDRWQPLAHVNAEGDLVLQRFLVPHWCDVIPFALSKGEQFSSRFPGPATYGSSAYRQQAEELYGGLGGHVGSVHGEILSLVEYDSRLGGAHGGIVGAGAGRLTGGVESMRTWRDGQAHTTPIGLGGVEIPGATGAFGKQINTKSRDIGGLAQYENGNLSLGVYAGITLGSGRAFGGEGT